MRIVPDTNVWISALISPRGTPAQLLRRLSGHTVLTSKEILEEVVRVLGYQRIANRYGVTTDQAVAYVSHIRESSELVEAEIPELPIIEADPSDDRFLVCAVAGQADCIVSGDRHLRRLGIYEGIPILTPADLLAFLSEEK